MSALGMICRWVAAALGIIVLLAGLAYGLMRINDGPLEEDNRILIRDEGKIYEQCLDRVMGDAEKVVPVLAELGRKYMGGSGEQIPGSEIAVTSGAIWMFEVSDCE
jgi:hypothetical protein